ncbi:ScbA/BarX family gamma-butyrolactone biosynthesis protein [Streptantibioticus silvisoli]|uniref:ScbA/BarX family gamma-butyrolactone biosynthesis protein n=1 Tax=Streptantibioticus silvisoli TaxID=2705255 RepID=A0ABT6WAF6_9ACTN|nr:ScbA/BarX family gamma-butyrolactone biosynthesis protein [Streptantibioticus silvisoli]MDI5966996.1 ScbA/BarX family gamma-butyrolactone biosynthesis protein [Streptantibioticus silvisoli]
MSKQTQQTAVRPVPAAAQAAPAPAGNVSPESVHKVVAGEVLLTGHHQTGQDAFDVTARWPQEHPFYGPRHGFHDPLLVAESVRQCVPFLSHVAYGVPFGHRQSWSRMRYALSPAALVAGERAAKIEMRIACPEVVRRGATLSSVDMRVDILRDGVLLGTAQAGFLNHSPAVYRRLRGAYADLDEARSRILPLAPPVAPRRVIREDFADVVLSPTDVPHRFQLRVDLSHPALFDHPVDHVPGMLLLEAARQAAHSVTYPRTTIPVALDAVFSRYVEYDAPCWIHADPLLPDDTAGRPRVLISAHQSGRCVFSCVVTMDHLPSF